MRAGRRKPSAAAAERYCKRRMTMNNVFWLIGVIVVILAVLSLLGIRWPDAGALRSMLAVSLSAAGMWRLQRRRPPPSP